MRSTPSFYGKLFCSRRSFTAQCLIYVSSTDVFLFRPSAKVPSTQCLQYSWESIRGHRNSVHHPRCRQFPPSSVCFAVAMAASELSFWIFVVLLFILCMHTARCTQDGYCFFLLLQSPSKVLIKRTATATHYKKVRMQVLLSTRLGLVIRTTSNY